MALFCISLMTTDGEHVFMYLLAMCISSLEKFYSSPSLIFELCCFCFVLRLSFGSSLSILDINPLLDI